MDRTQYNSFVSKLQEIFMMDHAELDFGIYRIMNYKRKEINDFLTNKLLPQVETVLKQNLQTDSDDIKEELDKAIAACIDNGFNPDESTKVKELRAQLASSANLDDLQSVVFSRLTQFFSRYYKDGDFISQRRYKSNGDSSYMLPYNGEEVKLVWANQDQYYIKTSEYFKNYTFILPQSRNKVHFVLKDASTEQNNNKNQNGMERRFALWKGENGEAPLAVVNGDLEIYFTYELMPKATKQKDLMTKAYSVLKPLLEGDDRYKDWRELMMNAVKADRSIMDITWLQKHLNDYTAKNSFDYFIHKDLGGFLRRELDFYIKNEVLVIDDLTSAKMKSTLAIVKAIEQVGNKIITFLAQLEDFQKKLWLKKKFVVGCDYCITLDRIPEDMYSEIIANDEQRKEWVRLFAIDEIKGDLTTEAYSEPLTIEFLKQNPFLVLDTKFFSLEFKHKLLATMENIDGQCNGLLVNSENFQALELLINKYSSTINAIYIDPPYNTNASKIAYKNGYEHSSWVSLMNNRLVLAKHLLSKKGIIVTAIDDYELRYLNCILDSTFGRENFISNIAIYTNPKGRDQGFIAQAHDYSVIYAKDKSQASTNNLQLSDEDFKKKFSKNIEGTPVRELPLKRTGTEKFREDRPFMFFPFFFEINSGNLTLPTKKEISGLYNSITNQFDDSYLDELLSKYKGKGYGYILPESEKGEYLRWRWGYDSCLEGILKHTLFLKCNNKGIYAVYQIDKGDTEVTPKSFWFDERYDASSKGTNILNAIVPNSGFDYPKSLYTVEDTLKIVSNEGDIVVDFFAGSATTAHAVIDLQRNGEARKYLMVEVNEYFDSATKMRTERVIYSQDWKGGKPISRQGVSQCFKYIRLEQYEDTLNNLIPKPSMPSNDDEFQESYMLGYMLDTDTRGSLLNLKMFKHPFDVKIKTTKDNELVDTPVDMVETFNYLIGLNVETESWHHGGDICVVEGKTHIGNENTLVIWRDCDKIDNDALNEFFRKQDFNTLDMEYDVIYVNGDNTLPNVRRDEDHWKVVLTEDEFKTRMFEED